MRVSEPFIAGASKQFNVVGNFFRIDAVTGATAGSLSVEFWHGGSKLLIDRIACDPGDWARAQDGFDRIEVTSTINQTVTFEVCRGDVGSDRITGEVSVIDGGKGRTLSGVAFMGGGSSAQLAANFSHVQLWNPSATKRVIVEGFALSIGPANSFRVGSHSVALTTLVGVIGSKLAGAAASTAELRLQQNAAQQVSGSYIPALDLLALTAYSFRFLEPVVLPQNQGLVLVPNAVNTAINGTFEFFEELI